MSSQELQNGNIYKQSYIHKQSCKHSTFLDKIKAREGNEESRCPASGTAVGHESRVLWEEMPLVGICYTKYCRLYVFLTVYVDVVI